MMHFVSISVADLRAEPKFESERYTQYIYGEEIKILEEGNEYSRVVGSDGIKGYMKTAIISDGARKTHKLLRRFRHGEVIIPFGGYVSRKEISEFRIPANYVVPRERYDFKPTKISRRFLGVPYLWAGTSEFGFDCSGLVQRLFRFSGIELPRNSAKQRDYLRDVGSFSESLPGDLIFFKGHVGLHLGDSVMIHANGKHASVTTTDLSDGSVYSKYLMSIFEKIGRTDLSSSKRGTPLNPDSA
jgi:hypothetical protein